MDFSAFLIFKFTKQGKLSHFLFSTFTLSTKHTLNSTHFDPYREITHKTHFQTMLTHPFATFRIYHKSWPSYHTCCRMQTTKPWSIEPIDTGLSKVRKPDRTEDRKTYHIILFLRILIVIQKATRQKKCDNKLFKKEIAVLSYIHDTCLLDYPPWPRIISLM